MADTMVIPPVEQAFPTWLFFQHPDGRLLSQVFDDETSWRLARDAGWRSSPASFGIETHPSQPGLALAQSVVTGALPAVTPNDLAEITALLTSMQAQLDTQAQRLTVVEELVVSVSARMPAETSSSPRPIPDAPHAPARPPAAPDDKPATPGRK